MAKKATKKRVLDFLEGLPLWARTREPEEETALRDERQKLAGVKAQLLEILSSETLINTGRVQILGLQSLKDELGDKWDVHRDFVHKSLGAILRHKLSPTDVYFRYDDDDYVIVFATAEFEAAKLICAGIMQELSAMLVGKEETKSIKVRTAVGVVDGRLLLEETSLGDVLNGLGSVESGTGDVAWDENAVDAASGLGLFDDDEDRIAALAWEPLEYSGARKPESYQPWTKINEEEIAEGVVPEQFELVYRPMWNAPHEIISTFTTNFVSADDQGRLRNAYSFVRGTKLTRAMDVTVLKNATATAMGLFEQRYRFVLAIPHHYESVTNWTRLYEYAEHCKAVPKDMRNYLILSCDDFPPGVPASKLQMIGYALRPLCRGLAANVPWRARDLAPFADAGFTTVGLFIPPETPLAASQIRIDEFAESGRRRGLQTAVLNVHDMQTAEIARNAGIDYFMGRLIGDYQETPGHMSRLPWAEIAERGRKAS